MNPVKKINHAAYYPFTYFVKWDNINKMKFGESLRNKINTLFAATEREKDISLVKQHISTSFDSIFFAVQSGPKLSPFEVLEIVKSNVYCAVKENYPEIRIEILNDTWTFVNWSDKSDMKYIPYYTRFDLKHSNINNFLNKELDGKPIKEIVTDGIDFAINSYNKSKNESSQIERIHLAFHPHSVELVVACPLNLRASIAIGRIKGASSFFIRDNFSQFKEKNNPFFIDEDHFWSKGKFYALSSYPIKQIRHRDIPIYEKLRKMWDSVKSETDPNEKGKLLEIFSLHLMGTMDNFEILKDKNNKYNINLGFEEIDLTLINKSIDLQKWGQFIKVECKNYKKPIGNDLIRDFSGKLRGDELRLGLLISVNGFGKFSDDFLVRYLAFNKKLIVRISGYEIDDWLSQILTSLHTHNSKKDNIIYNMEYMLIQKIYRSELELM